MAKPIENLARRLEADPFFLACPLKLYARSEGLTEEELAAALKCAMELLHQVRLCRAPAAEGGTFQEDIERIAARFLVDANVLEEAVRRGQALYHMAASGVGSQVLMAARDKSPPEGGKSKRRKES